MLAPLTGDRGSRRRRRRVGVDRGGARCGARTTSRARRAASRLARTLAIEIAMSRRRGAQRWRSRLLAADRERSADQRRRRNAVAGEERNDADDERHDDPRGHVRAGDVDALFLVVAVRAVLTPRAHGVVAGRTDGAAAVALSRRRRRWSTTAPAARSDPGRARSARAASSRELGDRGAARCCPAAPRAACTCGT